MNMKSSLGALMSFALGFGTLLACTGRAGAQQFYELAAGWSPVAPAPASSTSAFSAGPSFRGSIGQPVAARASVRFDADAMFFRLHLVRPDPCPDPVCPVRHYNDYTRAVFAVTANGLVSFDSRRVFSLLAGLGVYDVNAKDNSIHFGGSAGVDMAIPVGRRYRPFVEATWHGLATKGSGPSWVAPFAVGLRF
jgi:hypothetical protein